MSMWRVDHGVNISAVACDASAALGPVRWAWQGCMTHRLCVMLCGTAQGRQKGSARAEQLELTAASLAAASPLVLGMPLAG